MGCEVPGEFVIVEEEPTHSLEALISIGRCELANGFGQPHQYRSRLRHSLPIHLEHRDFAHRVGHSSPTRIPCLAAGKIDPDRLPIEAGAIQVECDLVGIS